MTEYSTNVLVLPFDGCLSASGGLLKLSIMFCFVVFLSLSLKSEHLKVVCDGKLYLLSAPLGTIRIRGIAIHHLKSKRSYLMANHSTKSAGT